MCEYLKQLCSGYVLCLIDNHHAILTNERANHKIVCYLALLKE
jgi:hypothetical protein